MALVMLPPSITNIVHFGIPYFTHCYRRLVQIASEVTPNTAFGLRTYLLHWIYDIVADYWTIGLLCAELHRDVRAVI